MTTTQPAPAVSYDELVAALRGDLIHPADPGYDQPARSTTDDRPASGRDRRAAATPPTWIACVRFARRHASPIAVRGGGHNAAGLGVRDDALVVDLSLLRARRVDPDDHTVRADGGCTWGDVDHATRRVRHGHPSGFMSTTGVGGLTLGGGIGYLTRRFGLTVDNLLSADVVLADGSFVHRQRRPRTRTCSGRCAAAAATSASSPRSPSAATPSASTA